MSRRKNNNSKKRNLQKAPKKTVLSQNPASPPPTLVTTAPSSIRVRNVQRTPAGRNLVRADNKRLRYPVISQSQADCATQFLKGRLTPEADFPHGLPCNLKTDNQLSYKYRAVHRGTFAVGSAGSGGVVVNDYVLAKDVRKIFTSSAAYGLDYPDTGNLTATNISFPYDVGAFTANNVSGKIVGACIRVMPTSPITAVSGIITSFSNQTNTLLSTRDLNNINTSLSSVIRPVQASEIYKSIYTSQDSTKDDVYVFGALAGALMAGTSFNRGLWVSGASPGSTFFFEYYEIIELTVQNSDQGLGTRSDVDTLGYSNVSTIEQKIATTSSSASYISGIAETLSQGAMSLPSTIIQNIADFVGVDNLGVLRNAVRDIATQTVANSLRSSIMPPIGGGYMPMGLPIRRLN